MKRFKKYLQSITTIALVGSMVLPVEYRNAMEKEKKESQGTTMKVTLGALAGIIGHKVPIIAVKTIKDIAKMTKSENRPVAIVTGDLIDMETDSEITPTSSYPSNSREIRLSPEDNDTDITRTQGVNREIIRQAGDK